IAEMVLEGGKSGDDLSVDSKGGHLVGDALFRLGDDGQDRPPQLFETRSLRLLDLGEIGVDLLARHAPDSYRAAIPSRCPYRLASRAVPAGERVADASVRA